MSLIEDLDSAKAEERVAELRLANRTLMRQLDKAKAKTEDLVDAVYRAARDAIAADPPRATPRPPMDRRRRRAEVALWHLTDWQGGKRTLSYNTQVMRRRVLLFTDKAEAITELQRADHPVNDCTVLFGGDMVEGLFNFPNQVHEVDSTLFVQWTTVSGLIVDAVKRSLAIYPGITTVVGEWGNHGRLGSKRDAVPTHDNLDRMCYETARMALANEPRLRWEDCPEDIQRVEIGDYRAISLHGDEVGRTGFVSPTSFLTYLNKLKAGGFGWAFRDAYCVDPTTEALTPSGWRRYDEIGDQPIAIFNPNTDALEWDVPQAINVFDYSGLMFHHQGRSADHFATPNHTMWVRHHAGPWQRRKAQDTVTGSNWLYRAAPTRWDGEWSWPIQNLTGDPGDLAEFVGWFVSEGHAKGGHITVAQHRAANPAKHQRILELMGRLGLNANSQPLYVRACNTALVAELREAFGSGAVHKQLPEWVKNWPQEQLARLFESLILGDGNVNRGHDANAYTTVSHQLAGDVQEIAMKLGRATTLRTRRRADRAHTFHVIGSAASPERHMPKTLHLEQYDGKVWCPTVRTGLWFMRRNGRVMVTGNSAHYHNHHDLPMADGTGVWYQTGSTESDNRYARNGLGTAAQPSQRLHFVDPEKGHVTAQYKIRLGGE